MWVGGTVALLHGRTVGGEGSYGRACAAPAGAQGKGCRAAEPCLMPQHAGSSALLPPLRAWLGSCRPLLAHPSPSGKRSLPVV